MVKYEGGGTQLLKDMASGKVDPELRIRAMTEALQVANDVNGVGALGLDKSFLQRNPAMRYFVQFASQPYRVARMMNEWGTAIAKGSLPEKI